MARYRRTPLAAAIAVATLSLATITVHLPPPTGAYVLNRVLDRPESSRPSSADQQQSQLHSLGAGDWMQSLNGPVGLSTTHPDGAQNSTGTGRTAAGPAPSGDTARVVTTPSAVPTTRPAKPGAIDPPSEPATTPQHPHRLSESPGTGPTGGTPSCPAAGNGIVSKAPGTDRTIALTFDDGPGPQTPAVLDILATQHVHATFFVIGKAVAASPATVTRTAAEGHLIGNHTWDHDYPRAVPHGWTVPYLREQLNRTAAAVADATNRPTCFFRPPGGHLPHSVKIVTSQVRQQIVLWSVDPQDWEIQNSSSPGPAGQARQAEQIYRAAIAGTAQKNPMLLLHDSGGYRGATVAALPRIITYYKAYGYRFVRLDGRS